MVTDEAWYRLAVLHGELDALDRLIPTMIGVPGMVRTLRLARVEAASTRRLIAALE